MVKEGKVRKKEKKPQKTLKVTGLSDCVTLCPWLRKTIKHTYDFGSSDSLFINYVLVFVLAHDYMISLYFVSFSFHVSLFLIPTLQTENNGWKSFMHCISFRYPTTEGIISYQNIPYHLAVITTALIEKKGSVSPKEISKGKSKW